MNFLEHLLGLILPVKCLGCEKVVGASELCKLCEQKIKFQLPECYVCRRISKDFMTHRGCLSERSPFDQLIVCGHYNSVAKNLMKNFKFRGIRRIAKLMVEGQEVPNKLNQLNQAETLIIPVPSHTFRRSERGFNPTEIIACEIAMGTKFQISTDLVSTSWRLKHQAHLSEYERRKADQERFYINESTLKELKTTNNIIIIDDVISTGATISSLGLTLKRALPNSRMIGLVLFRGRPRWKEKEGGKIPPLKHA